MSLAHERLFLGLVVTLAFLLRTGDIFWHPFGPDEYFTVTLAQDTWRGLFEQAAADTHPPVHYVIVKLVFMVFGEGYFQARMVSVFFSSAAVGLTYLLARRWYGVPEACCAALVMTLAPYQVYWGHVARIHSVFPFFVLGIILLSYHYRDRGDRAPLVGLVALWLVSITSHYMTLVFGLIWGVVFILPPGIAWGRCIALALTPLPGLIAFTPWVMIMREQMVSGPANAGFWQDFMTPISLYYRALFGQMTHLQPPHRGPLYWLALGIFCTLFILAAKRTGPRWQIWFLLFALPGLPMLIALWRDWTLAERHLLFAIPIFNAFIGAGVWAAVSAIRERFSLGRPPRKP